MDEAATAFRHKILACGQIAADIMREPAPARVEAVFRSTFYLNSNGHLMCLGHQALEPGPLNCVTTVPVSTDWRASGLKRGMYASISPVVIRVGNAFRLSNSGSTIWTPERNRLQDAPMLREWVAQLRAAVSRRNDIPGLGSFLVPGFRPKHDDYVCRSAEKPIVGIRQWLTTAFGSSRTEQVDQPAWVGKLSGLGPGLTPSGDDFLGGTMITLHGLGEGDLSEQLWRMIQRHSDQNRNPISHAHLCAASHGMGSRPVHQALAAVSNGDVDEIDLCLNDLARIGHSSGWDILTGVVTTLQAWLDAQTTIGRN